MLILRKISTFSRKPPRPPFSFFHCFPLLLNILGITLKSPFHDLFSFLGIISNIETNRLYFMWMLRQVSDTPPISTAGIVLSKITTVGMSEELNIQNGDGRGEESSFDYSYVSATARVALYDDLKSAPRITKITPDKTTDFIEHLTTTIYEQSKLAGGKIPYTLIREVSENFIHARFQEIVVSILDDGNTIRFADQGPGIAEKEKAQKPGFSSATEPMKDFIRGVGSGFPIVKDYLDDRNGSIVIEDNIVSGAVVTISLVDKPAPRESKDDHIRVIPIVPLSDREKEFLAILAREGSLGVTDLVKLTNYANSTTYNTLKKLEEAGLVEKESGQKRALTEIGRQTANSL